MINVHNVKSYCCEDISKIKNYEKAVNDKTQVWECHHKNEQYFPRKTLIAIGWYYDCRPDELIFLTESEHMSLHHKCKKVSSETKKKMSDAKKNISEETRLKMSDAHKGQIAWNKGKNCSEEQKRKFSEAKKGKHWKIVDRKRVWY